MNKEGINQCWQFGLIFRIGQSELNCICWTRNRPVIAVEQNLLSFSLCAALFTIIMIRSLIRLKFFLFFFHLWFSHLWLTTLIIYSCYFSSSVAGAAVVVVAPNRPAMPSIAIMVMLMLNTMMTMVVMLMINTMVVLMLMLMLMLMTNTM